MDLGIPGLGPAQELGRTPAVTTYRSAGTTGGSVVVKVLAREATPDVWARFDHDQSRLAELAAHPNVVAVLGHGRTARNEPYVVLADVPGGSFAQKVGAGLDGVGVLALGIRVAGALESCHRRDVVHGDLRPEDILVDATGEPQVADFGLVVTTGYGPERATTPARIAHAAPEQIAGQFPTPATDVYALGSILYALLAGAPAFVAAGELSVANVGVRIRSEQARPLTDFGVPAQVAAVVDKAMAKDPAARYASAEGLGVALQQAQIALGQPLTPMVLTGKDRTTGPNVDGLDDAPATAPTTTTSSSRTPLLVGGGVLAVVLVLVAVFVLGGGDDAPPPDDPGRGTITLPPNVVDEFEFRDVADDSDTIRLSVPDIWGEADGSALGVLADVVVADGDPIEFTNPGGLAISGVEVTAGARDDFPEPDADGLRDDRVAQRQLDRDCTTNRPPEARTIDGFEGSVQRFENCGDARAIIVFGGVDGDAALVIEIHVNNDDDEAVLDAVLDSVTVAG